MPRYAIIDEDGKVVNVVVWDGSSDWQPPKGATVRRADPDPPPSLDERVAGATDRLNALTDRVAALVAAADRLNTLDDRVTALTAAADRLNALDDRLTQLTGRVRTVEDAVKALRPPTR